MTDEEFKWFNIGEKIDEKNVYERARLLAPDLQCNKCKKRETKRDIFRLKSKLYTLFF